MRERPNKLTRVLELFKTVARKEILKDFREDSCIASTRTTIRVLAHYGYKSAPLPVECIVYNPDWVDCVLAGFHPPLHSEEDLKRWCAKHNAWSLGIGIDKHTTIGHLIATLPRYGLIVDASLSQANRPAKNISLPRSSSVTSRRVCGCTRSISAYYYTAQSLITTPILLPPTGCMTTRQTEQLRPL